MARLTTAQHNLGVAASILAIIQAIAWFVMSLLCIIQYNDNKQPESKGSYANSFDYYVYTLFLYKGAEPPSETIVTPNAFVVFMWIYLVICLIWFASSVFLIHAIQKNKLTLPSVFVNWGLVTCAVSCVDLVLVILTGYDYDQVCVSKSQEIIQSDDNCYARILVLVIAARGFALWLLNVVFSYIAFISAVHLTMSSAKDDVSLPRRVTRQVNSLPHSFPHNLPPVVPRTSSHTLPYPSPHQATKPIPRATLQSTPSLYLQHEKKVKNTDSLWNLNLRTVFSNRTPPATPHSPISVNSTQRRFFNR